MACASGSVNPEEAQTATAPPPSAFNNASERLSDLVTLFYRKMVEKLEKDLIKQVKRKCYISIA
jgi:hypothetical protein